MADLQPPPTGTLHSSHPRSLANPTRIRLGHPPEAATPESLGATAPDDGLAADPQVA